MNHHKNPDSLIKFPRKFQERLEKILPKSEWKSFYQKAISPLPRTVRINKNAKIPPQWEAKQVPPFENVYLIPKKIRENLVIGNTNEYYSGDIYPASLASLLGAHILGVREGEKVLDMCASPGSKATALSEAVGQEGVLIANEPSSSRIKKLVANLERMRCINTIVVQKNGENLPEYFDQEFDKILIDAPCSSEGFGRKDPKFFMKQWSERNIHKCVKIQKSLLRSGFSMLKKGGEILYSTCTSSPEENELIIQHLLDEYPEAEIVPIALDQIPHHRGLTQWKKEKIHKNISSGVLRLYPHLQSEVWDSEIFFLAKIRKVRTVCKNPKTPINLNKNIKIFAKKEALQYFHVWEKQFGVPMEYFKDQGIFKRTTASCNSSHVIRSGGEIFITNQRTISIFQKIPFTRAGILVEDQYSGITSNWVRLYGKNATKNIIKLPKILAKKFVERYDIFLHELDKNIVKFLKNIPKGSLVLVFNNKTPLGHAKWLGDKIKNKRKY